MLKYMVKSRGKAADYRLCFGPTPAGITVAPIPSRLILLVFERLGFAESNKRSVGAAYAVWFGFLHFYQGRSHFEISSKDAKLMQNDTINVLFEYGAKLTLVEGTGYY